MSEEIKNRVKNLNPIQQRKLYAELCRFAGCMHLVPVEELTPEELDDLLVAQGVDLDALREATNQTIAKCKAMLDQADFESYPKCSWCNGTGSKFEAGGMGFSKCIMCGGKGRIVPIEPASEVTGGVE